MMHYDERFRAGDHIGESFQLTVAAAGMPSGVSAFLVLVL